MAITKINTKIDEKFYKEAVPYVSLEVKMIYFSKDAAIEIEEGGKVTGFWDLQEFLQKHKPAEE